MHAAFQAWDRASEPLETTELRIHDGVPVSELRQRADWYLDTLSHLFPWSTPKDGSIIMEIGSGLGYVLEAAVKRYIPRRAIGLDVAPSMIDKAKTRLARDRFDDSRLEFLLYDGITIPLADDGIDYIYSVAALQHVPKVYVYNLFLEIKRILAPGGYCAIHLLSCNNIREHSRAVPFAQEIGHQIRSEDTHWHHFYAFDELLTTLADGVEAKQIDIIDGEVSIWVSFAKTGATFSRPELPNERHLALVQNSPAPVKGSSPEVRSAGDRLRAGARRMLSAAHRVRDAIKAKPSALETTTATAQGDQPDANGRWPQDAALLPWYDQPDRADRLARIRDERHLDAADEALLRKWCEDGYVVVPSLVSTELIDAFVGEIDAVWERSDAIEGLAVSDVELDDGHHVHVPHEKLVTIDAAARQQIKRISNWRVGQYHLYSDAARTIVDLPAIARIASTIYARPGQMRYSLMFSKGTEQQLHQDTCVFHVFPRNFMMGIWIACENIELASGPLEYYPGSHRTPLFPEFDNYPQTNRRTSDVAQSARYDEFVAELAKAYQRHVLLIRKGDVMFWHPMLIHGGSPRLDRLATRKSFVLHNIAEGADMGGKVTGPVNW
jgi:ectoine hydroxylase-related dioxygenase (phytanoyl-CoA dioxygenase family)/SAM-dependent methyltransferase